SASSIARPDDVCRRRTSSSSTAMATRTNGERRNASSASGSEGTAERCRAPYDRFASHRIGACRRFESNLAAYAASDRPRPGDVRARARSGNPTRRTRPAVRGILVMSILAMPYNLLSALSFFSSDRGRRAHRRHRPPTRPIRAAFAAALAVGLAGAHATTAAAADSANVTDRGAPARLEANEGRERPFSLEPRGLRPRGWIVHLDNDLFAFTDDDRDYTAGISVTLGGDDTAGPKPLTRALEWIDRRTGFGAADDAERATVRSFETGLLLFTPQDLDARDAIADDRPYANLGYVSTSRLVHAVGDPVAHQSSLTIGVLGLPFVEQLHRQIHVALGGREPIGYAHEISKGGEPTARYAVTRYRLLGSGVLDERPYHARLGLSGSIGYLTEVGAELEFRWGNLHTP